MKVLLAGAFGNLGFEILKTLIAENHQVIAADLREKDDPAYKGKYTFVPIDVTRPDTLEGICDGVDIVISTVGLTTASSKLNCYDIDYAGNMAILREAKKANVGCFHYISVIQCDSPDAKAIPMLHAKHMFEQELKKSGLPYVIYRPTGYFYDIVKVFRPYVESGEMRLLKGYGNVRANVVDCPDFAQFIVAHMQESGKTYEVGGKETYTYIEMTQMCFEAAGKPVKIKWAPKWLFGILANLPKIKKAGKHDIILFSRFTLTHDLVGKDQTGDASFRAYIQQSFGRKEQ